MREDLRKINHKMKSNHRKFLKVESTILSDGTRKDYYYKCPDGKTHVGLSVIERSNPHGILEMSLLIGNHHAIEKITVLTDRAYVPPCRKRFKASEHMRVLGEASRFYLNLCAQYGF